MQSVADNLAGKIAGKSKKLLGAIKKGFGNRPVGKRKDDQVAGPNSTSALSSTPQKPTRNPGLQSLNPFSTFKSPEEREAAKLLQSQGFNINSDNHLWAPLFWAVSNNHEAAARLVLSKDTDNKLPTIKGLYIRPLLNIAAERGYDNVVTILLDAGFDMRGEDQEGMRALSEACRMGHSSTTKLLLDRGANPDAWDNMGRGPLHKAAQNGHASCIRLLLDAGAGIEEKDRLYKTALQRAADQALKTTGPVQERYESVVALLVERGASVEYLKEIAERKRSRGAPRNPFVENVRGYFVHIGGCLTEPDPYPWGPRSRYERETGMVDPMILRWD
jgi:ankyrin repeat protein